MLKRTVYNPWEYIVIAMLSTGGYRLEKTFNHRELLIKNGLTDPRKIASMNKKNLALKLVASGYDRGPFLTAMFTDRLSSLGELSNNFKENERILIEGTKEEVSSLLKHVKGVGPVVIEFFFILREGQPSVG